MIRLAAAIVLSLSSTCVAQELPAPTPAAPERASSSSGTTMLATGRYLFVVRGDVLYQFDVDTLALRHSARLGEPGADTEKPVAEHGRGVGGGFGGPRGPGAKPAPPAGPESSAAISLALQWLKLHQDEDGRWDADEFMKHDAEGAPCDGRRQPGARRRHHRSRAARVPRRRLDAALGPSTSRRSSRRASTGCASSRILTPACSAPTTRTSSSTTTRSPRWR